MQLLLPMIQKPICDDSDFYGSQTVGAPEGQLLQAQNSEGHNQVLPQQAPSSRPRGWAAARVQRCGEASCTQAGPLGLGQQWCLPMAVKGTPKHMPHPRPAKRRGWAGSASLSLSHTCSRSMQASHLSLGFTSIQWVTSREKLIVSLSPVTWKPRSH